MRVNLPEIQCNFLLWLATLCCTEIPSGLIPSLNCETSPLLHNLRGWCSIVLGRADNTAWDFSAAETVVRLLQEDKTWRNGHKLQRCIAYVLGICFPIVHWTVYLGLYCEVVISGLGFLWLCEQCQSMNCTLSHMADKTD